MAAAGDVPDGRQPTAPYLDALVAYGFRGVTRFHVPGHKGGPGADPGLLHAIGESAFRLDVPQDTAGIDVGPSPTPYELAEQLAAEAYGARRSWFLTNGATQGNHALCLALAPLGTAVVLQRNAHASMIDGLVLSGGLPAFVSPEYDRELGLAHGVTPEAVAAALARTPGAAAVFVVSPTYYGIAADVAELARVAHDAGAALVVDQAWGPHFGFHGGVPQSALALGADAVLTSTHKIVGSLAQSAMLHVARDGLIDPDRIARAIRLVRSTSPSSLLLASLDGARRQLAVHGEALLSETIAAAARTRTAIDAVPGCSVVGEELVGAPGAAASDPLRIVIDVRGTGCSGYEVAAALKAAYDIHPELATQATLVLVLGAAQPVGALERFAHDFAETIARVARPGAREAILPPPAELQQQLAVAPRDAFLGAAEVVEVDAAVGRVSCEAIAGYPPGIPALLPGERVTAEVVAYLRELVASGARLHGASDPTFETINVLRSDPAAR
ncbi:amino acid decarboxylase [Conexibacter sp. JD483]|uniref:aminotransferase class I/II-fold pyridoxal phosphate-dependent enzyme n=1 Tax=unclassified Conexibacter TaxID=2627773 RepID=UPI002717FFF8|nr:MULTISPECIES: amino acid decarboxylase [unclassified Conexibacter]MDO8186701.1 amino acid decarboxylase [Conexibacter sp. CPCC 205706]MDO8200421.1 amino acid decarboxylase [Conexibacter sp. CPCC 205762]MDR9371085.1 amino acid decarboxylase [Conexibacter sp. JD483]